LIDLVSVTSVFVVGVWFKEGDARNVASGYLQGEFLDQGNTVSNLF
jgi:hypothetical protein